MMSMTPCFSLIQHRGSKLRFTTMGYDFDIKSMEIGTLPNVCSKRKTDVPHNLETVSEMPIHNC
ncbi:hypothetical protein SAMN05192552_10983 [Natrinema hispanicum]|uniref:Uncharacterized protein n=1 Tax=Natrinema hispanicum TaxID=392421 RepID=A0A1G6ZHF5_9EURY|nr:hypothetical protein SAMN05192552_10983 [Natrinema hispanicum]